MSSERLERILLSVTEEKRPVARFQTSCLKTFFSVHLPFGLLNVMQIPNNPVRQNVCNKRNNSIIFNDTHLQLHWMNVYECEFSSWPKAES